MGGKERTFQMEDKEERKVRRSCKLSTSSGDNESNCQAHIREDWVIN